MEKKLQAFVEKMAQKGLPDIVINAFAHYFREIFSGADGLISDREILPVRPGDIPEYGGLDRFEQEGHKHFSRCVWIVLNGGLGTSMGLTGPKSLLIVKDGLSFLDLIVGKATKSGVKLGLMNSFSTHESTMEWFAEKRPDIKPLIFMQHMFPKVLQKDLAPARWPQNPSLEWNPPGHGDIFAALETSGLLNRLLSSGIEYAYISNCDNVGASVDPRILGYFAGNRIPFLMEVARRAPSDSKGGHIAFSKDGGFLLREIAQCPEDEKETFSDIKRHFFFNTNNIWINLSALRRLIDEQGMIRLPMILNPKPLDPRDESSPAVFQIETAMGSAISLFKDASVIEVPLFRFSPVKKCNDLLAVRSDYFVFEENNVNLVRNPYRRAERIQIDLDPEYFGKIDDFEKRFPAGPPSLAGCTGLVVKGDVRFESGVVLKNEVKITNRNRKQAVIKGGTISGRLLFS